MCVIADDFENPIKYEWSMFLFCKNLKNVYKCKLVTDMIARS